MEPILEAIRIDSGENDDGAIRDLSEDAKDMRQLSSEFLAGETNHVGTRDHGDVGENKDECMVVGKSIWSRHVNNGVQHHHQIRLTANSNGSRDNRPEQIAEQTSSTRRLERDLGKVYRMEALAATLASRLDPSRGPGVVVHLLALLELVVGGRRRKSAVLTPSVSQVGKGVICLPRGRGGRGLLRHDDLVYVRANLRGEGMGGSRAWFWGQSFRDTTKVGVDQTAPGCVAPVFELWRSNSCLLSLREDNHHGWNESVL
jgi:hypothetical protein